MPMQTKRVTAKKNSDTTLENIRIRRNKTVAVAPMLSQKIAPAGVYTSKIAAVAMSRTDGGEDAVDVTYELTDANGKVAQGRIRYPVDGYHLEKLLDALAEAGVPEGSSISEAVGTTEQIEIVYPQKGSLAKIKNRRPLASIVAPTQRPVAKSKAHVEDDDEFDDFLESDDEDDF